MNVLIVGGSGFLSGAVAREARRGGHRVWVVTRGRRALPDGVCGLVADRHDHGAFLRAVREPGIRFDLAVDCIGFRAEDMRQDLAVLPGLARHFVFISTDFVFDPCRRVFPQTVEHSCFLTDDSYGAHKRRCEEMLIAGGDAALTWTILRPCHIYGPGSQLGCLPRHGRDPELLARLRRGEALALVGAGHFLQQPVFAADVARVVLACPGAPRSHGRIFHTAGPDIVESARYYQIIADLLSVPLRIDELPVAAYRAAHPEHASFLCHRIYDLSPLTQAGLPPPATPLVDGLREHVCSLNDGR